MPFQPTPASVHVNRPLTNISVFEQQSYGAFVASRAFRNVDVLKQSDKFFQIPRGAFNRDEMKLRGPATESAGSGYLVNSDGLYNCDVYALHKDIPDQIRKNTDDPLQPDRETSIFLTLKGLLKREKLFASQFLTTSIWTSDKTGVSGTPGADQFKQWNDAASTPIEDIRAYKRTVLELTGVVPNVLVLGRPVYDTLLDHPDVIDRVKYGQTPGAPAMASTGVLARLFEVDEILVSDAIENTGVEGGADSHAFIVGKVGLLLYRPPAPGLMTAAAGYTFSWSGLADGYGQMGTAIYRYRMDWLRADRVEIEMAFDMVKVAADLGVFLTAVIA